MQSIEISLIISVYNGESYLESCLKSAINQDFDNYEIILINDGSTDNTEQICKKFADCCDKICYYSIENGGISHARNFAFTKSHGKYISFSDADDLLAPQYLSFMYNLISKYEADIVMTDTYRGERDDNFPPYISHDTEIFNWKSLIYHKFRTHYPQHQIYGKLFKRCIFEQIKFPENHVIEDYYVYPDYCYLANKIVYNRSKLYLYCVDSNNSIMRSEKAESFLRDQLMAPCHWFMFFKDKDIGIRNSCTKTYLEKLFSSYGLVENGLIKCDDKAALLAYIKKELDWVYPVFSKDVKFIIQVSKANLYLKLKPKYFVLKHCLPLTKYLYKDFYKPPREYYNGVSNK